MFPTSSQIATGQYTVTQGSVGWDWPFQVPSPELPDSQEYLQAVAAAKTAIVVITTSVTEVNIKYQAILAYMRANYPTPSDAAKFAKAEGLELLGAKYLQDATAYRGALAQWQQNAPIREALGLKVLSLAIAPNVPDLAL